MLTQWRSPDDVVALQLSSRYQDTVKQLLGAGMIDAVAPASLWPVPVDVPTWARTLGRRVARALELLAPGQPAN